MVDQSINIKHCVPGRICLYEWIGNFRYEAGTVAWLGRQYQLPIMNKCVVAFNQKVLLLSPVQNCDTFCELIFQLGRNLFAPTMSYAVAMNDSRCLHNLHAILNIHHSSLTSFANIYQNGLMTWSFEQTALALPHSPRKKNKSIINKLHGISMQNYSLGKLAERNHSYRN